MTVFFRTTGTVAGPEFFLRRRGGGLKRVRLPVTVALIERPDGLVLVDTGWSRRTCAFPQDDPGRATALFLGLEVHAEDAMASQVIGAGYSPDDVKHIVATHLHTDHVGGVVDFPRATLHATRTEWDALGGGRLRGYDTRLRDLSPRTKLHDLTGEPALGFGASHDLFGDGTVLLLDAGGHTAGSVAVAVRLEQGWFIHAGDAAMFREDYRDEMAGGRSLYARVNTRDPVRQRTSWRALHEAERVHEARVVPSHDPAVFETLPHTREDGWKTAWDKKPGRPQQEKKPREPKVPQPERKP